MNQTVLQHFGILGQKWGIRRYQNPDGSLTPRGQARLDKKDNRWAETKGKRLRSKYKRQFQKIWNQFIQTQLDMSYTPNGKNFI